MFNKQGPKTRYRHFSEDINWWGWYGTDGKKNPKDVDVSPWILKFLTEEKFDFFCQNSKYFTQKIFKESLFKNIYLFVMQTVSCSM